MTKAMTPLRLCICYNAVKTYPFKIPMQFSLKKFFSAFNCYNHKSSNEKITTNFSQAHDVPLCETSHLYLGLIHF